jgi:hypothetical protein
MPLYRQSFAPVWSNPVEQEAFKFILEDGAAGDEADDLPETALRNRKQKPPRSSLTHIADGLLMKRRC